MILTETLEAASVFLFCVRQQKNITSNKQEEYTSSSAILDNVSTQLSESAIEELMGILHQETGRYFDKNEAEVIGDMLVSIVVQSLKIRARMRQDY